MKIDRDIKPPRQRGEGRASIYPFNRMEVDESVFIPAPDHSDKAPSSAYNYARRCGKQFTARKENGGYRIWRIA